MNIFLDLSNYISHFSSGIALINNSLFVDTPPLETASATPTVASAADRPISSWRRESMCVQWVPGQ